VIKKGGLMHLLQHKDSKMTRKSVIIANKTPEINGMNE